MQILLAGMNQLEDDVTVYCLAEWTWS